MFISGDYPDCFHCFMGHMIVTWDIYPPATGSYLPMWGSGQVLDLNPGLVIFSDPRGPGWWLSQTGGVKNGGRAGHMLPWTGRVEM